MFTYLTPAWDEGEPKAEGFPPGRCWWFKLPRAWYPLFVTTGEATVKARQVIKELGTTPEAEAILAELIAIRGAFARLETGQWTADHTAVLVIAKNRAKNRRYS